MWPAPRQKNQPKRTHAHTHQTQNAWPRLDSTQVASVFTKKCDGEGLLRDFENGLGNNGRWYTRDVTSSGSSDYISVALGAFNSMYGRDKRSPFPTSGNNFTKSYFRQPIGLAQPLGSMLLGAFTCDTNPADGSFTTGLFGPLGLGLGFRGLGFRV